MGTMHQARSGTPSRFAGSNRQWRTASSAAWSRPASPLLVPIGRVLRPSVLADQHAQAHRAFDPHAQAARRVVGRLHLEQLHLPVDRGLLDRGGRGRVAVHGSLGHRRAGLAGQQFVAQFVLLDLRVGRDRIRGGRVHEDRHRARYPGSFLLDRVGRGVRCLLHLGWQARRRQLEQAHLEDGGWRRFIRGFEAGQQEPPDAGGVQCGDDAAIPTRRPRSGVRRARIGRSASGARDLPRPAASFAVTLDECTGRWRRLRPAGLSGNA